MVLPRGCMWLGVVTLSGVLLASSIPWVKANSSTTENQAPVFQQVKVSANKWPTGTCTQTIRKQFNWTTSGEPPIVEVATVTGTEKAKTESAEAKTETKSSAKPVRTASVSSTNVSRGSSDKSELINNAMSLQGIPYVFGGTSRNGFDCSGFTQYVFAGSKITLPRTSFEQYKTGTSVSRQQLQQGDLVFFTTYQSGASHVGIYISGGNFIHASIKGVKISNLNESYYNSHYIGACRVQ